MFWPCFYTTLTTIVAFGSLAITDIKPIIDFGFIMIIALTISFCCSFTILPLMLIAASNNLSKITIFLKFKDFFSRFVKNFNTFIILASLILFVFLLRG